MKQAKDLKLGDNVWQVASNSVQPVKRTVFMLKKNGLSGTITINGHWELKPDSTRSECLFVNELAAKKVCIENISQAIVKKTAQYDALDKEIEKLEKRKHEYQNLSI